MRRLLSSPRRRRRLFWSGSVVLALAAIVGLGYATFEAPKEEPRSTGPGWAPPAEPRPVQRSAKSLAAPLAVATRFVQTAVARNDVDASWPLLAPALRQGYTRKRWATGEIPVVPFPVGTARWQLDYSFADTLGLKVALFPPPRSDVRAAVFNIDLRAFGAGKRRYWLVESFMPAGGNPSAGVREGEQSNALGLPDLGASRGPRHLGVAWLLVPVGLLSLALLVPLAVGIGYWRRSRRIEREYAERRNAAGVSRIEA